MPRINIRVELCKKCGQCVDICPEGLFHQAERLAVPKIVRQKDCIGCGHCVSICPADAVNHLDFPTEDWSQAE